jgi:hypothetical protein
MSRPRRFVPPAAGGAQKTGWEALEKWVGSGADAAKAAEASAVSGGKTGWEALEKWVGSGAGAAKAAEAPASGKTGWEALDKWVGDGTTPSAETSAANGGAGAEQPVAAGASTATEGGGGLMGFLKRLFGGK